MDMTTGPDGATAPHRNPAGPDLAADPRAQRVRKLPIPVHVMFAASSGMVETLEGPVRHEPGDAILTGVQGERWPVQREAFDRAYAPVPPTRPGADGTYIKRPLDALALPLRDALTVPVGGHGDRLHGQPGDWLLQYGDCSYGVVSSAIFQAPYERL